MGCGASEPQNAGSASGGDKKKGAEKEAAAPTAAGEAEVQRESSLQVSTNGSHSAHATRTEETYCDDDIPPPLPPDVEAATVPPDMPMSPGVHPGSVVSPKSPLSVGLSVRSPKTRPWGQQNSQCVYKPSDVQARAMYRAFMHQSRQEDSDDFDMILAGLLELALDIHTCRVIACCIYARHNVAHQGVTVWETMMREFGNLYAPSRYQAQYVFSCIMLGDCHVRTQNQETYTNTGAPATKRLVTKFCNPFDGSGLVARNIWTALNERDALPRDNVLDYYKKFCSFFTLPQRQVR